MFRRAIMTKLPMRSGGHAHPDFPFLGYYKHKRIISQTENNLWVYDGMNPEYLVDILAPQYTFGHILYKNFLLAFLIPCAVTWILAHLLYRNMKRPYYSKVIKNENNEVRKYLKRIMNENTFKNVKNPFGHIHSYENEGWVATPPTHILSIYNL